MKNRLKEPSTWAGLAAMVLGAKALVPAHYGFLIDMASMAFGGVAGVLAEKGKAA